MRIATHPRLALRWLVIVVAIAAVFAADTASDYEIAAAVFYAVVIMVAAPILARRGLLALAALCILLTLVSFALSLHGDLHWGLINTGISLTAISITTFLILQMAAARTAAHAAQAQLLRMTRVKSLAGLTTSIAHEINQPLGAIATSGHACQRWLAQDPPNLERARQALARMLDDTGRASTIIVRVRSLTRGEPPHKSAFDLNLAVAEIVAQTQAEITRHQIVVETSLCADLPQAYADRVQIQQVIANLVLNAIEAMAGAQARARTLRLVSEPYCGMSRLSILDTGNGLAATVRDHLFEAFWTTKPDGIGVGLSISRAIVEANGGQIWGETTDANETAFRFTVPVAPATREDDDRTA